MARFKDEVGLGWVSDAPERITPPSCLAFGIDDTRAAHSSFRERIRESPEFFISRRTAVRARPFNPFAGQTAGQDYALRLAVDTKMPS